MAEDLRIFLGLGSNIDDRYQNLKKGIQRLNDHAHIWVIDQSHVYQSPAMYNLAQKDFFNMVIEIETNLNPLQLLNEVKKVEKILGETLSSKRNVVICTKYGNRFYNKKYITWVPKTLAHCAHIVSVSVSRYYGSMKEYNYYI